MCGRYLIDDEAFDIREIIAAAERNANDLRGGIAAGDRAAAGAGNAAGDRSITDDGVTTPPLPAFRYGEVFPGSIAPIVTAGHGARFMLWGFPNLMAGKQPLINARSETAAEKRTFSDAMASRRCLVPASGYYEWKSLGKNRKEKYEFTLPGRTPMYMAGIYTQGNQFAILTRAASPSVACIHDRMPVILSKTQGGVWLNETMDVIREALTELQLRFIPGKDDRLVQMSMYT